MTIPATRLTTTVYNPTGGALTYSFLGPHGTKLEAGEELTVVGDVEALVASGSPQKDKRRMASLLTALQGNTLAIKQSPSPILYDQITDQTKMVSVANSAATAITPDYSTNPIVTTTTTTTTTTTAAP